MADCNKVYPFWKKCTPTRKCLLLWRDFSPFMGRGHRSGVHSVLYHVLRSRFCLKCPVRGVSMLISIENNPVPICLNGPPYKIYLCSLNWWIFLHGNKMSRIQNKLNLTKNKKNNQLPWATVCQSQKRFSLFQHTGDSLEKGKNGKQLEF